MFGMPALNSAINAGNNGNQGPQVRGFGFLHDGSVDTLFRFHNATVFNGGVDPNGGDTTRPLVAEVLLVFDTNLHPILRLPGSLPDHNAARAGAPNELPLAAARQDRGVRGGESTP